MFITKNGVGDMLTLPTAEAGGFTALLVILSVETYEKLLAQIELYAKLAEAEAAIDAGDKGKDFIVVAEKYRHKLVGSFRERI